MLIMFNGNVKELDSYGIIAFHNNNNKKEREINSKITHFSGSTNNT